MPMAKHIKYAHIADLNQFICVSQKIITLHNVTI